MSTNRAHIVRKRISLLLYRFPQMHNDHRLEIASCFLPPVRQVMFLSTSSASVHDSAFNTSVHDCASSALDHVSASSESFHDSAFNMSGHDSASSA